MTSYNWNESYKAALIETSGTKMRERIEVAEAKIRDRQRVLSEDHEGTPEERQAIADAVRGLKALLRESAEWPDLQASDTGATTPD